MYPKYMLVGGGGTQWSILIHNGPMFPPLYVPHNIPIQINGKSIKLNSLAEEYITMYARYVDTEYIKKPKFNKNFLSDWKKVLEGTKVDKMEDVNLTDIKKYLDEIKETKSKMSKEEKLKLKKTQDTLDEPYKYCFIDGGKQKVGNFKIEPPGIFLGRGEHPKLGKIKKRVNPEDVTINISKTTTIPKPNVPGKWGKIIHNNEVVWLATWVDNISGKNKYIFTSMESIFKSKSDKEKFDLARQLKKKVQDIRATYYIDMKNTESMLSSRIQKQNATAVYLIDNLALRVGGKKDTKEKADTVGVTSLRVEHIVLFEDNIIKLDFLGKDSVRYCKKVKIDPVAYDNIKEFTNNKKKRDLLFDIVTPTSLNNYLDGMLKGLTAKVWRTYNASILFQNELDRVNTSTINKLPETEKINYLMSIFNQANTAVAVLCNHQKNVSVNLEKSVETIDNTIDKLKEKKKKTKNKDKLKLINAKLVTLKMKKDTKIKQKNVSLGTSKNNYIDPRIIFAYQKKYNIPQDKLFNTALITRFEWASDVSSDYKF
jgi:DNA topoisomerase-1